MKKFGLLLAGGVAAIVLLHTIGPMIGLLVGLVLFYFLIKQFLKAKSLGRKIALGLIGFIIFMSIINHVPALMSIVAVYVLYVVYKNWNEGKSFSQKETDDPFINFEKQWNEIMK